MKFTIFHWNSWTRNFYDTSVFIYYVIYTKTEYN